MPTVLVTGASGMIGKALTKLLTDHGFSLRSLVRDKTKANEKNSFYWNYMAKEMDLKAFENLDYIINLAGASVSKRWTEKYKKEIYDSRIKSTEFLFETVKKNKIPLKKFISASATGYYGDSSLQNLNEESANGKDFLAKVCLDWEQAALKFNLINIPACILRLGVVMTPVDGFVKRVSSPIKFYFGAHLGSGKQYISWIALEDLINLFLFAIQKPELEGIYNAIASTPLTLEQIDNAMAAFYHTKIWLPNIPAWALKLALGEMAVIVLASCNASNVKIKRAGFVFGVEEFRKALEQWQEAGTVGSRQ